MYIKTKFEYIIDLNVDFIAKIKTQFYNGLSVH